MDDLSRRNWLATVALAGTGLAEKYPWRSNLQLMTAWFL